MEYSDEDLNGLNYFVNNKLVRHDDKDGTITEYEYENDNLKQSTIRKDGKILKTCSYVNGILDEVKSIEE